ncbi:MAG TPA: hypothetical protein PLC89_29000 [Haliscomenobacter sp.]|uniref:hypothetical protein n=1 Tax=Haliscomenobacter sp. TaxID=2717303 RepID=UPI002C64C09D|nr:hypothetical protein [Haliscomenobacter sp.]HOY21387.1 hypothetical protein [Haliscomenobacter sp.]
MAEKNRSLMTTQARVRMLLKQIPLDQGSLAQKLNISQPVISLALNGHNDKTFERIVDLLIREYHIRHEDIYQEDPSTMQQIQERLDRIESSIEELKEMIQKLGQKR